MSRYRLLFVFIIALCFAAAFILWKHEMVPGLDIAGGVRVVYEARPEGDAPVTLGERNAILRILERRVNASGVVEPVVQPKGDRQFIVEIPAKDNKEEIIEKLSEPTKLEFIDFRVVKSDKNPNAPYTMTVPASRDDKYSFTDAQGNDVPASEIIAKSRVILTGKDIADAQGSIQGLDSVVVVKFKAEGRKKFGDYTRRNVGAILAMVLNDEILSAPRINEPILQGEATISGNFTSESAQELAENLKAGALPVPIYVVEQNSVEASLGKQNIEQSKMAGIYGVVIVAAFMLLYYLLPGIIAVIALAMYAAFTFAIFEILSVTITLPGLAGFILSIGMAVDANILIFERMKEELRNGKTLHNAIDAGFNRAWTAILDSNVCTLITCAVLIFLTSGPVVGFAKTLGIGVLVSMFTAITVSRTLLHIVSNMGFAQNPKLYGLQAQWGGNFNVIAKTPVWFTFSGLLTLFGLYFVFTGGLKPGIEFTGGQLVQVAFPERVNQQDILSALSAKGIKAQVQLAKEPEGYTAFIRTDAKEKDFEKVEEIRNTITSAFKEARIASTSFVGPSISAEITYKAILAVVIACIGIMLYLSFRFAQGGFVDGLKYGVCALIALVHDVLVVLGASALFGRLMGWEIDGAYVTAILTVVGFSVHDTIVIFDRVRENLKLRLKGDTFEELVNRSVMQSFARSINTSLTVIIVLGTLLAFGGAAIKHFNAVLLVGVVIGTYSSIFNASPMLVLWEKSRNKKPAAEQKPLVAGAAAPPAKSEVADDEGDEHEAHSSKPKSTGTKRRKRRY